MIEIVKMGEGPVHDSSFFVNRPQGYPYYLLLLTKSSGRFYVNGEFKDYPENCAVIYKPFQKHLYGPVLSNNKAVYCDYWMHFKTDAIPLNSMFPYGIPFSFHQVNELNTLFDLTYKEFYSSFTHKNSVLDSLVNALICKLSDECNIGSGSELYYKMLDLRQNIYTNPAKEWKIGEICKKINVSEGYFYSVYKEYFGVSCINDVIQSRISFAQELLLCTNKTVEQIAELCGYNNTEHFIRQFKKINGCSPLQFKKNPKENN